MRLVIPFTASQPPELSEVGGKGLSLIRMTERGLPVPPGFVLTRAFFEPWLEAVRQSSPWHEVLSASPEALPLRVAEVQAQYGSFELDDARRQALAAALQDLKGSQHTKRLFQQQIPSPRKPRFRDISETVSKLYAVRSSSPEEDLEGVSFAGGYETVLGVTPDRLQEAIWRCAASCLTERVLLYKRQQGFDAQRPRIAVIVQQQIAADKAGVAFSLNPLNNCYDECVVNANFGLGETVVSGRVSPDEFLVDKPSLRILERRIGSKETSVWLQPDGGTKEEPDERRAEACLSEAEVAGLVRSVIDLEEFFGKPVDVEWAAAPGAIYLLQARPITAYFPLPQAMRTRPAEPKRLYLDNTLTKLGMSAPMSRLGSDFCDAMSRAVVREMMGAEPFGIEDGLWFSAMGRLYVQLSNTLKMAGKKRLLATYRTIDTLSCDIIEALDLNEYVPNKLPWALKMIPLKTLVRARATVWNTLQAIWCPEKHHERFLKDSETFERELAARNGERATLRGFATRSTELFARYFSRQALPVTLAAEFARARIDRLFRASPAPIRDKLVLLQRALPHNCTVEMGLRLYQLVRHADVRNCRSAGDFVAAIEARSLSADFRSDWDDFLRRYGHRCPDEMDAATPRAYETPAHFYAQLRALAEAADAENNPQAVFERGVVDRQRAYASLLEEAAGMGRRKRRSLEKAYRIFTTFAGYRELPKNYIVRITEMFRSRALHAAGILRQSGRLAEIDDVFNLTIDEIDAALSDPSGNFRPLTVRNTADRQPLRFVRDFPRIIDSRGKILRAHRKEACAGEMLGQPISPGVVQGKVKVLRRPGEKPLLPGEILVARATDPGWTPLFLNAAGILLEVGGLLQHGALVAREYCKPCVAGLEDVTERLQDGQLVEVDGTNGTIRLIA